MLHLKAAIKLYVSTKSIMFWFRFLIYHIHSIGNPNMNSNSTKILKSGSRWKDSNFSWEKEQIKQCNKKIKTKSECKEKQYDI